MKIRKEISEQKGKIINFQCKGCKKSWPSISRICSSCREFLYEWIAKTIDKSYDSSKLNEWEACAKILNKLYCWCTERHNPDFMKINNFLGDRYLYPMSRADIEKEYIGLNVKENKRIEVLFQ